MTKRKWVFNPKLFEVNFIRVLIYYFLNNNTDTPRKYSV